LDEPERAVWLEALAQREPEMADLVSEALKSRERAGYEEFLATPPPLPVEAFAEATLTGRNVGPYVIDAQIGRGGMGSVWRAHRVDGRYEGVVAIKFVHASWIGHAGEQRFQIEGNLLGRLDHPNIARLIDAGVLDGTQPYLVLEYVEGEAIDTYCAGQKLGLEARVELFLGVLSAVANAHSHLIVHRDIKPSNIFVTHEGVVKLLDFGIAKLLREDTGAAALTKSSASAMTPEYAAPEQMLGKAVTTQTDVYSLGLVLYVLLTGTHPITSEHSSGPEFIKALLTREPARASAVTTLPTIRRRELEGDLDNILGKALKKAPDERYASVGAFADDLRRFLTHEPVRARPDTVTYRVSKFVRRHQGGVLSALLITVALIGTTSFALWELKEARAERDTAVSEGRRAQGHDVMMGFLFNDSVLQTPEDAVHKRLDRAREFIERRYRGDPDIAASLLLSLRSRYLDIADAKSALEARRSAQAIANRLDDPYLNAEIACAAAQDLAVAGDIPTAKVQLQSAFANISKLRVVSAGLKTTCAEPAGRVARVDGDYAAAIANNRVVVDSLEEAGEHGSESWVGAAYELATSLGMSADYRGAFEAINRILEVLQDEGLKDTAVYFSVSTLGCAVLRAGGQPENSIAFVGTVIANSRGHGGDIDVPYYVEACRDLSRVAAGEAGSVEENLLRNAKAEQASGMPHISIPFEVALVNVAINRRDLATADARWLPLAPSEKAMLDAKRSGMEASMLLMAHTRLDLLHGQPGAARRRLEQLRALMAAHHQSNADERNAATLEAEVQLAVHDYVGAVHYAEESLKMARETAIDPKSSAWIGEALLWRARAEAASGDPLKARASAREALPHLETNMDSGSSLLVAAREIAAGT
jgi:eukaryotic-like serine/threonine-protein kinase